MRTIILFLLLASPLLAQKPAAPFHDPNDSGDDPEFQIIYEQTIVVPSDGNVVILFTDRLPYPPSCSFEGGTIPGEKPKVSSGYAKLKAKAGAKMHYKCYGVKDEETARR
jgi:hypothetical protein